MRCCSATSVLRPRVASCRAKRGPEWSPFGTAASTHGGPGLEVAIVRIFDRAWVVPETKLEELAVSYACISRGPAPPFCVGSPSTRPDLVAALFFVQQPCCYFYLAAVCIADPEPSLCHSLGLPDLPRIQNLPAESACSLAELAHFPEHSICKKCIFLLLTRWQHSTRKIRTVTCSDSTVSWTVLRAFD